MKTNGQSLVMVDFAARDNRSVGAMLKGKGDGREKEWLKFREQNGAFFTEEDLHGIFKQASRRKQNQTDRLKNLGKGILAVGVVLAVVF